MTIFIAEDGVSNRYKDMFLLFGGFHGSGLLMRRPSSMM